MDERFQVTDKLFTVVVASWFAENRDFGRLADWSMVSDHVALPEGDGT